MTWFFIVLLLFGLVAGALGRLAVPGPNPMGLGMTILVGIGGAALGGIIGLLLFGRPGGVVLSIVASALIVWYMERKRAPVP